MKKRQQRMGARGWALTALVCAMPGIAQQMPAGGAAASQASGGTASARNRPAAPPAANQAFQPCTAVTMEPSTTVALGKSSLVRLNVPVARMVVGGALAGRTTAPNAETVSGRTAAAPPSMAVMPGSQNLNDGVAQVDITLLSPTELFLLGRRTGSMNLVLQSVDGRCFIRDVTVTVDPDNLKSKLTELIPGEAGIRVKAMDGALVLTGEVSDAVKLDQVMSVASSLGESRRVVNMMRVAAPQQVMVEVKIAEVSKTLLDRFGIDYTRVLTNGGGLGASVMSGVFGGAPLAFGRVSGLPGGGTVIGGGGAAVNTGVANVSAGISTQGSRATLLGIDAQNRDGLIRVLAEPNIMAISGQSASFLSGGKIFIPVAQNRDGGGTTITLQEKEFGVGLRFTPTVLDGGRVNLKLISEVSDLSQTGSPFTTLSGVTSVLPSMSTRRVDTTVQLGDGQSFAIAGLIKNNSTQSISRFPGLGDIPVLGALFRSTEYQKDQTELVFVVTPRLVRPLRTAAALPTDVHAEPARGSAWLSGKLEGSQSLPPVPASPPPVQPTAPPRAHEDSRPDIPAAAALSDAAPEGASPASTAQEKQP